MLTSRATNSLITQFQYDILGRLVRVTDPIGCQTAYQYDVMGNILNPYPEVEVPSSLSDFKGEIDIKWFEYVWEVKPGYRQENFTKSLKKYIPGYDPNNPSAANGNRKPGYLMKNSPSAKLLNIQTAGGTMN